MNLEKLAVRPEWRTATVVQLCLAMRESQTFEAMPILADAIQDAGCPESHEVLQYLRKPSAGYAISAGVIGCVLSEETAAAVRELVSFSASGDCPEYETLVAAATGHHEENAEDDAGYSGYFRSENDGEYLHFGGRDAHGAIPPEFWDLVQKATGKRIPDSDRATSFSCSC